MKSKRIVWIDLLKAVGFFFVILGHFEIGGKLDTWIYSFHMPLFLLATGFTFNVEKCYKTSFKDFFLNCFKKLIVPYFWLQMISLAILYLRRIVIGGAIPDLSRYAYGILISNTSISKYSPGPALYYILLLFFAEIALWAVIRLAKCDRQKMFILLFLLLPISFLKKGSGGFMHIYVTPVAMMMIFIGRILMDAYNGGVKEKLESLSSVRYFAVSASLLITGSVLALLNGRSSLHGNRYGKDFAVYVICALFINIGLSLVLMKISDRLPHKIRNMYVYIGQSTLFYLGVHAQLKNICEQIGGKFIDIKSMPFILICAVSLYFLLVPLSKITDKLFPFVVGKSTVNPGRSQKLCQAFMTFFAFSPVCYVIVRRFALAYFSSFVATLSGKAVLYAVVAVLWAVLCLGISEVVRRVVPIAYLIEKPKNEKSIDSSKSAAQ